MARLVAEQEAKIARRKKRPKTIAASSFNRALAEVDEMIETRDWSEAKVRHLVALYDRMHEKVYGIEDAGLGATQRHQAALIAGGMVKNHFAGDIAACIEYMRWVWSREIGREKWRRENQTQGRRIGIRLIFSGAMLTDYRLALARKSDRT